MIVLLLAVLSFANAEAATDVAKELAEFLGPVSPKKIAWTKTTGSDFDSYSGRAIRPCQAR